MAQLSASLYNNVILSEVVAIKEVDSLYNETCLQRSLFWWLRYQEKLLIIVVILWVRPNEVQIHIRHRVHSLYIVYTRTFNKRVPFYLCDDFILGEPEICEGLVLLQCCIRLPPSNTIHVREKLVVIFKHVHDPVLL